MNDKEIDKMKEQAAFTAACPLLIHTVINI